MTDLLSKERLEIIAFGSVRQSEEEGRYMARELLQRREAAEKNPCVGFASGKAILRMAKGESRFCGIYPEPTGAYSIGVYLDQPLTSAEQERLVELEKLYAATEEECAALRFKHCPVNAAYFRDEASRLEKELAAVTERLEAYDRAAREPVLYCMAGNELDKECISECKSVVDSWVAEWNSSRRISEPTYTTIPLFTVPPLPVVPEIGVTDEHRRVIEMLLRLHKTAYELADDACEQEIDGGLCYTIPQAAFNSLSIVLDDLDTTLPTDDPDRPDVYLAGAAPTRSALKALLKSSGNSEQVIDYKAIVERISEIVHGKVTDIDLLTITIKSMTERLKDDFPATLEGCRTTRNNA